MGQGASREAEPQEDVADGVRVTQNLLDQLAGRPHQQQQRQKQAQGLAFGQQRVLAADTEAAAAAAARQDPAIARALDRSRRVGGLLLKREQEELAAVEELAAEIISREYSAPSRAPPCQGEAAACLACYRESGEDALRCADAVDAYSRCAREAWAEALQREPALS